MRVPIDFEEGGQELKLLAILGVSLVTLVCFATPVSAGIEPVPWQPQINELGAVTNHLVAIRTQLKTDSIPMGVEASLFQPMGVEPMPWQPVVNHFDAITIQLAVMGGQVDAVLAVVPAGDPNVETALGSVASEARDVANDAEALADVLPPECDAALDGVISAAQSIILLTAPVISFGTITIPGTFSFDFDAGTINLPGTLPEPPYDVFWEQFTATTRAMVPIYPATIANLGAVSFGPITRADLVALSYGTTPISGSDVGNLLVPGDVFAVHTSSGNYAKAQVAAWDYGQSNGLTIQWVTY